MRTSSLPEMPAWHARSFYASLFMALSLVANMIGVDFLAWTSEIGLGDTKKEVLDQVELLMPLLFALWAWIERLAPNFKLVWHRVVR